MANLAFEEGEFCGGHFGFLSRKKTQKGWKPKEESGRATLRKGQTGLLAADVGPSSTVEHNVEFVAGAASIVSQEASWGGGNRIHIFDGGRNVWGGKSRFLMIWKKLISKQEQTNMMPL